MFAVTSALLLLVLLPSLAGAQPPVTDPPTSETDIFDVIRQIRHKGAAPEPAWDYRKVMKAFAPVIGAKPSSGALFGVAGNLAFYRGEPSSTHISSIVSSVTFSTKSQTSITNRLGMFGRDDRWRLDADYRLQWTSLDAFPLGTASDDPGVWTKFDFFRVHHTAYLRLRPNLFTGAGFYLDKHVNVEPGDDAAVWADSPYVEYSERHAFPLDSQASVGPSVDLMWDSRDSFINASHGWLAKADYRLLLDGVLGGNSSWQRLTIDVRTYASLNSSRRHRLAVWVWSDLVTAGAAPYFDLPATGQDTYGRSARGYSEGQFRGDKLAYAEVEYRAPLTRNGLLGMVAFLNTTTVANADGNDDLFESFATAGGAGLRLLINKRSRTNLCFDVAVGRRGSKGVYLAIQEAF